MSGRWVEENQETQSPESIHSCTKKMRDSCHPPKPPVGPKSSNQGHSPRLTQAMQRPQDNAHSRQSHFIFYCAGNMAQPDPLSLTLRDFITLSWLCFITPLFFPPFSASLRVRSSVIPSSSLLPSAVSAVVSRSSSPFVALKAVVCFSSPPSSPNCSYRVPSSRRTRFRI